MMPDITQQIHQAQQALRNASNSFAFTGAGISVESGIPPFRGPDGLWSKYDPQVLDLSFFKSHPFESWQVIKEIFYDFFGQSEPNAGHEAIAELEKQDLLQGVITQNIDGLHQKAGSQVVHEFHGTSETLSCMQCAQQINMTQLSWQKLPPRCACGGIWKPDFIFFGEGIPEPAGSTCFALAKTCDLILVVGTTGEVMPASWIPFIAKENGAFIIEVNPESSAYTYKITDIFLQGQAGSILPRLIST